MKNSRHSIAIVVVLALGAAWSLTIGSSSGSATASATSPITHVVILDQENNSFDHLLGKL